MEFEIGDGSGRRTHRLAVHPQHEREQCPRRGEGEGDERTFAGERRLVDRNKAAVIGAAFARELKQLGRVERRSGLSGAALIEIESHPFAP